MLAVTAERGARSSPGAYLAGRRLAVSGCAKGRLGGRLPRAGSGEIWLLIDVWTVCLEVAFPGVRAGQIYWINIYSAHFSVGRASASLWLFAWVAWPSGSIAGAGALLGPPLFFSLLLPDQLTQSSLESAQSSRHQRSSCTWACGLSVLVGVA